MEETDENRRLELVQQILQQIKHMGGSPARMLFVLNRIDAFLCDHEADRRRDEHISKVKQEIHDILYEELREHRDTLANLTYSPLSSLPALHAQHIKIGNDRIQVARDLKKRFGDLIGDELLDSDLQGSPTNWRDHDFKRLHDAIWQNSYGEEFFASLDRHIQAHFPTLVIPSIVQRFEKEVSDAIGEAVRTCYSELNSSEEDYKKAEELLHKQNAELREFLGNAKQTLIEPFDYLAGELKKSTTSTALEIFSESLLETEIYQGRLTDDKLNPLFGWQSNLKTSALGILAGMRNSLDKGYPSFKDTSVEMLPSGLQKQLADACQSYSKSSQKLKEQEQKKELDGSFDDMISIFFNDFIKKLNDVVGSALDIQSKLENKRIHGTVELLMKQYLDYLRNGIEEIAPEWNLSISDSILDALNTPEINPISLNVDVSDKTRTEGIGWTLWIFNRTIKYKTLPDSKTLHDDSAAEIMNQVAFFVPQFQQMIYQYIVELTDNISEEQDRVSQDFSNKLTQAHLQQHDDYEKSVRRWQPLHEQSQQLSELLKQLVKWESI